MTRFQNLSRRQLLQKAAGAASAVAATAFLGKTNAAAEAPLDTVYGIASPRGNIRTSPWLGSPVMDYLYCGERQDRLAGGWGECVSPTCSPNECDWWWKTGWYDGGTYRTGWVHSSVGTDYPRNCC